MFVRTTGVVGLQQNTENPLDLQEWGILVLKYINISSSIVTGHSAVPDAMSCRLIYLRLLTQYKDGKNSMFPQ